MGQAVSYALSQWESLQVYLREPKIEIDNNLVENAIRPTALGKKNWLFFGCVFARFAENRTPKAQPESKRAFGAP